LHFAIVAQSFPSGQHGVIAAIGVPSQNTPLLAQHPNQFLPQCGTLPVAHTPAPTPGWGSRPGHAVIVAQSVLGDQHELPSVAGVLLQKTGKSTVQHSAHAAPQLAFPALGQNSVPDVTSDPTADFAFAATGHLLLQSSAGRMQSAFPPSSHRWVLSPLHPTVCWTSLTQPAAPSAIAIATTADSTTPPARP
jgi:hypothetical protein